jgi:hypothetical protein
VHMSHAAFCTCADVAGHVTLELTRSSLRARHVSTTTSATKLDPGKRLLRPTRTHASCSLQEVWALCRAQTSRCGLASRAILACTRWLQGPQSTQMLCATCITRLSNAGTRGRSRARYTSARVEPSALTSHLDKEYVFCFQ